MASAIDSLNTSFATVRRVWRVFSRTNCTFLDALTHTEIETLPQAIQLPNIHSRGVWRGDHSATMGIIGSTRICLSQVLAGFEHSSPLMAVPIYQGLVPRDCVHVHSWSFFWSWYRTSGSGQIASSFCEQYCPVMRTVSNDTRK